jgi:hypothetical protein
MNSLSMHPIMTSERNGYMQAPLGGPEAGVAGLERLPGDLEQVFNKQYASERMRYTGANLRENTLMQSGDYWMFNSYEHTPTTCQTASVQGARPSLFWSQTASGSQCPAAVSIDGMDQRQPTAKMLIEASTQVRQARERFADTDPFVSLVPNDGSFGTRLMGAPPDDDSMEGCDTHIGSMSANTSACALGSGPQQLSMPIVPTVSFYGTDGVDPEQRAVLGGVIPQGAGCSARSYGGTNASLCATGMPPVAARRW